MFHPLRKLQYRDPVRDIILGFMHNWLEGILEHQLRALWGIGRDTARSKTLAEFDEADDDEWTDSDISESETERNELKQEAQLFQDPVQWDQWRDTYLATYGASSSQASGTSTPRSIDLNLNEDVQMSYGDLIASEDAMEEDSDHTPVPASDMPADEPAHDESDTFQDIAVKGSWSFDKSRLAQLRAAIQEIILPTWVARPPGNLGEPGHRSLKADQYLILFTVILPLVIPEIGFDGSSDRQTIMLKSFQDLVAATIILTAFQTSIEAAV
uniref:Uncharacterized protein n=1 Tax=Mycena chlorophos TaxID=658473 RepID=A0ABQ0KYK7_MYCCL|nr:predicted protein [Mycena chlorophos]